jgi:transmembrane sensor
MPSESTILKILNNYYHRVALSEEEEVQLQRWLAASESNQQLFDELSNTVAWEREASRFATTNTDPARALLQERIRRQQATQVRMKYAWQAAALIGGILVLLGGGWWWWTGRLVDLPTIRGQQQLTEQIVPGHPDSVITVETGEGKRVVLVEGQQRPISEKGETIAMQENNQLDYSGNASTAANRFNTIRIPIGKQFQVVLQDGTVVWLNAVSQLRYPVHFSGATREVELEGAGYFQVQADPIHPFIVRTTRGRVQVTGTRFVVLDYATDSKMYTGLEEGKVNVQTPQQTMQLTPGQVVEINSQQRMQESAVALRQLSSWKEQKLWFRNATYEEIFQTLVRWYAIEVRFETSITARFSGVLPTNRPLQELLNILEKTGGVRFQLKGRKLTITN